MQLEVGNIVEGKVTGITKFGAFIELPGGKTGMVHISEVADTYVKEIRDFLTDSQMVKVKVLGITDDGKINLSIKKAQEKPAPRIRKPGPGSDRFEFGAGRKNSSDPMSFEDMMAKFKQASDDKMSDLKKSTEVKRGSSNRRSPQK